jgi:hypothetical protein
MRNSWQCMRNSWKCMPNSWQCMRNSWQCMRNSGYASGISVIHLAALCLLAQR